MAKELVLNILANVLGDYIEGFSKENLKIGILSGKIVLKNLKINESGIRKLNLPFNVTQGIVKQLDVCIPWKALDSQPVKIFIDGVYVLLEPQDCSGSDPGFAHRRVLFLNQYRLFRVEKTVELKAQLSNPDDFRRVSYMRNLTAKIIDNLEISVTNIHVRCEDAITFPLQTISFGITFASFSIITTNSEWQDSYISDSDGLPKYKLASLRDFSVYWDTDSATSTMLKFDDWVRFMQGAIYKASGNDSNKWRRHCIVLPPNELQIKLTHDSPHLGVRIESPDLQCCFTEHQYKQAIMASRAVSVFNHKQYYARHRPVGLPSVSGKTARAWWKYALLLITEREDILVDKMTLAMACCRYRRRYVDLIVRRQSHGDGLDASSPLCEKEEQEVETMESSLPLFTLVVFRELATREYVLYRRRMIRREREGWGDKMKDIGRGVRSRAASIQSRWVSRLMHGHSVQDKYRTRSDSAGSSPEGVVEGMAELQEDLSKALGLEEENLSLSFTLDVTVGTSLVLTVRDDDMTDLASLSASAALGLNLRPGHLSASVSLNRLEVRDERAPSPLFSHLVKSAGGMSIGRGDTESPLFRALYEKDGCHSKVMVSALPLEIYYNHICIEKLLRVFVLPPCIPSNQYKIRRKYRNRHVSVDSSFSLHRTLNQTLPFPVADDAAEVSPSHLEDSWPKFEAMRRDNGVGTQFATLSVSLEVSAPKIVIPVHVSRDCGYILVDAGYLSMSAMFNVWETTCSMALSDVSVDMYSTFENIDEMNCGRIGSSLILPFVVNVCGRNTGQKVTCAAVDIVVSPSICIQLNAVQLSKLIHIVDAILTTLKNAGIYREIQSPFPLSSIQIEDDVRVIQAKSVDLISFEVNLTVAVDKFSLSLQHGILSKCAHQCTTLHAHDMKLVASKRLHDICVELELGSFNVEDSARPSNQLQVISSPVTDNDRIIQISFVAIRDTMSARYRDYGVEIEMKFGKLFLYSDSSAIKHLSPFVEAVCSARTGNDLVTPMAPVQYHMQCAAEELYVPAGVCISVSLEEVSLHLMRPANSVHHHDSGEFAELESVIVLDMQYFHGDIKFSDEVRASMGIKSISILDARNISQDYHYRYLLRPNTELTGNSDSSSDQFNCFAVITKNVEGFECSLDVSVNNISCYVSLDVVMDIIDVSLTLIGEVNRLMSCIVFSRSSLASVDVDVPTIVHGHIQIPNPTCVFLEDPTSATSRAVVFSSSISIKLGHDCVNQIQSFDAEWTATLYVSMYHCEMFVVLNMIEWRPSKLLQPMSLQLHVTRVSERNIVTSCNVSLSVDEINARIMMSDVLLMHSILMRRTLFDSVLPLAEVVSDVDLYDIVNGPSMHDFMKVAMAVSNGPCANNTVVASKPVSVVIYKVYVILAKSTIFLLNDLDGGVIPLVRLVLDQAHFKADGFTQDIRGLGSASVNADVYNSLVCEWEPLVEEFYPELTLSSDSSSCSVSIQYANTLQLNLTSSALELMCQTYSVLKSELTSSHPVSRDNSGPPVTIHNETGLCIDICSSDGCLVQLSANDAASLHVGGSVSAIIPQRLESDSVKTVVVPILTDAVTLRVKDKDNNSYRAITGASFDKNGSSYYPLVLPDEVLESSAPIILEWNVTRLPYDDCKVVTISSTLAVKNELSYAVLLCTDSGEELGPCNEYGMIYVPISVAQTAWLKVKPAYIPCSWSGEFMCAEKCDGTVVDVDGMCTDEMNACSLYIRGRVIRRAKTTLVTLYTPAEIKNSLPCSIQYRIESNVGDNRGMTYLVERGSLEPGSTGQLNYLNTSQEIQVSLKLSSHCWASSKSFKASKRQHLTNIPFLNESGQIVLILSIIYTFHDSRPCSLYIFSTHMLVDRSGLNVSISTRVEKDSTARLVRHTYNHLGDISQYSFTRSTQVLEDIDDSCSSESSTDDGSVVIGEFSVRSRRRYEVIQGGIGTKVHTDRGLTFTYVPVLFRGQTFISTPCDDRAIIIEKGHDMIRFSVDRLAMVFVLFDRRVSTPPAWVSDGGFRKVLDQCIARDTQLLRGGIAKEIQLAMYGKVFGAHDTVSLGCNYSIDARDMYCVYILPGCKTQINSDLWNQVTYDASLKSSITERCWVVGCHGVSLFHCENGRIKLAINKCAAWTDTSLSIKTIGTEKVPFEIDDKNAGLSYQLAYALQTLPSMFEHTSVMTVMPRYCIVNCTGEPISVRQLGVTSDNKGSTAFVLHVGAYDCRAWHKTGFKTTCIQLKGQSTGWCFGHVDINEIGSYQVFLPFLQSGMHIFPTIINVEVKIADRQDNCAVSIILWRANDGFRAPVSIKNDSHHAVTVLQDLSGKGFDRDNTFSTYCSVTVPSKVWIPYGWSFPDRDQKVLITLGNSFEITPQRSVVDLTQVGMNYVLSDLVHVQVEAQPSGRVVRIMDRVSQDPDDISIDSPELVSTSPAKIYQISCNFTSIGVSLIADTPQRREIISLYADKLIIKLVQSCDMLSVECSIHDVQIDNYSDTVIHPVLLSRYRSVRGGTRRSDDENTPFIQIAALRQKIPGPPTTFVFKYFTGRILPLVVEFDSGTVQLFIVDMLSNLEAVSADRRKSESFPEEWMREYNGGVLSPLSSRFVDVYDAQLYAQQSKILYEKLVFHPIKVLVSFVEADLPSERESDAVVSPLLDVLASLAAVDLVEIRLNSFIVSNAVESLQTLRNRLQAKVAQDIRGQIAQIAGSLTVLGSPAGLMRNIGGGVQDFFYEPAAGLVQSPLDFIKGVSTGTTSLVSGVIGGTLSSTASIVSTASNGLSYLSGDAEFVKSRTMTRKKSIAARGGALAGLKDGGTSILSGIASGVTGIFTKPITEAQREGPIGFMKGVGMGVAGAAVKPVLGFTDGFSSIAKGISNEVGDTLPPASPMRPPRAFIRTTGGITPKVLCPLDMSSAYSQRLVHLNANRKSLTDDFICVTAVDETFQVVFSELFVFLTKNYDEVVWKTEWSNILCVFMETPTTVEILLCSGDRRLIQCKGERRCLKLYKVFCCNAQKVQNPAGMIAESVCV